MCKSTQHSAWHVVDPHQCQLLHCDCSVSINGREAWVGLVVHAVVLTLPSPPDVDFCPQAARCCRAGVDEYGWIAAAVGWSLWFLTLILLCVDKLMKLTPDELKDLQA